MLCNRQSTFFFFFFFISHVNTEWRGSWPSLHSENYEMQAYARTHRDIFIIIIIIIIAIIIFILNHRLKKGRPQFFQDKLCWVSFCHVLSINFTIFISPSSVSLFFSRTHGFFFNGGILFFYSFALSVILSSDNVYCRLLILLFNKIFDISNFSLFSDSRGFFNMYGGNRMKLTN